MKQYLVIECDVYELPLFSSDTLTEAEIFAHFLLLQGVLTKIEVVYI